MVEQAPPAASHRSRIRLVLQGILSLVLVVAISYFLRRKIDPAQTWAAITAMTWPELVTLSLLAVWNLCTYAFVWMTVTPGLGFWRAMEMTQATTAVANTVPGGSAIGIGMTYSMLGSWGYSRSRATTAVLVGRRASTRRGDWPMANRSAPPALHPQPQPLPAGRVAAGGEAAAAPSTWANYRTYTAADVVPILGQIKLQALTPVQLNHLYAPAGTWPPQDDRQRPERAGAQDRPQRARVLHSALHDAMRWGYSWWQAAAVPVVADGPAIYGMFRIVSRSRRGAPGAGYGWLLVGCGTAASIGGNVAHAQPDLVAQAIAATIPLAVLAMLEGLKGDAGEVTRLAAQAADSDGAGALTQARQRPQATTVRGTDTTTNLDTRRQLAPSAVRCPPGPDRPS